MIASFGLTSCCYRGNHEVVATLLKLTTLQFILYGCNNRLWCILRQFCYIKFRLLDSTLLIFDHLSHVTCATCLVKNTHKSYRNLNNRWSLKIIMKMLICDTLKNLNTLKACMYMVHQMLMSNANITVMKLFCWCQYMFL